VSIEPPGDLSGPDPTVGPEESAAGDDEGSSPVLRRATRAAVVLTVAGTAGQVFTLIRELFVASKVGASPDLDALLVAAVAPIMLSSLIAAGTTAAIVPGYISSRKEHGVRAAEELLGATITWTAIICVLATVLVIAGGQIAVTLGGPGLDQSAHDLAVGFIPILAPMLAFSAVGGLLAAMFQIHDRMRSIAVAWLSGPLVSVFITVGLWDQLGLTALAIAMTVQQAAIVIVLAVLAIRMGIFPRLTLRADRTESWRFIKHATPLTISSSVLQLNLLTDRAVATLLAPGAASALRYAEGVIRIPLNAIGPAWSAAIYPALVRASHLTETRSLGEAAFSAMRYITAIFVPLSVATAALAPLIIEVAYARGAFDARASTLTAGALVGFAPLLFLTLANSVLTGAHNARRRGVFLMSMGILNAILNAVFDVGLGLLIGVAGVALSTSLTVGLIQFIKAWRLGEMDEAFPLGELIKLSARSLVASLTVGVPIAVVAWNLPTDTGLGLAIAELVGLSVAGMIGYIVVGWALRLPEPWWVAKALLGAPLRLVRRGAR
jgi:putative peptidoglycan lipid II flippase